MAVPQHPRKCWDLWLLIALWKAEFADVTSLSPVALETYSLMSWYLQVKQPQGTLRSALYVNGEGGILAPICFALGFGYCTEI